MTHVGGAKGEALLASLKKSSRTVQMTECPKVTRFSDRLDFVRGEFRRAGRVADEGGLRALLDAGRSGLRELPAACSQLAADVEGHRGEEAVVPLLSPPGGGERIHGLRPRGGGTAGPRA